MEVLMFKAIEAGAKALNSRVYYDNYDNAVDDATTVVNAILSDPDATLDFVLSIDNMSMFDIVRSIVNENENLVNEINELKFRSV
jgi:hypothetical protein